MTVNLSEKDHELLVLLRQNARRSSSEIAEVLNVSRQTVQKRIDRLVASGKIQQFTIKVANDSDGSMKGASLIMFNMSLTQDACARVFATIRHLPNLKHCWSLAGDSDMVAIFELLSHEEADDVRQRLSRHADILSVVTTHILKEWR